MLVLTVDSVAFFEFDWGVESGGDSEHHLFITDLHQELFLGLVLFASVMNTFHVSYPKLDVRMYFIYLFMTLYGLTSLAVKSTLNWRFRNKFLRLNSPN